MKEWEQITYKRVQNGVWKPKQNIYCRLTETIHPTDLPYQTDAPYTPQYINTPLPQHRPNIHDSLTNHPPHIHMHTPTHTTYII